MKQLLITGVLIFSMSSAIFGQELKPVAKGLLSTKHILKTNLLGLAYLSVNANYEYKISTNTSVGILGGYKLPTAIEVKAIGDLDGERQKYEGVIEPQGIFLNPYFRVYPSEALTGFYIELFTRYYDYDFLLPYEYTKDTREINANLDGNAKAFGGGIAFGGQFELGPRVFLDVFAGFGIASGDVHLQTNDPNLDAEDYLDIKRNIDENASDADIQIFLLDSIFESIVADANETSAWADITNELFPLTRGGISIGYGF